MKNFRFFLSVFFLVVSVVIVVVIALFDYSTFLRAANEITNYMWLAGIAVIIFLVLLSAGFVSHSADYEGSLFSNGYILLATLELFVCAGGLAYYRYFSQQPGQIILRLSPETTRDFIQVGIKYQNSGSVLMDTVQAPGRLENRPPGTYSFEILDEDIVYFRKDVELEPAEKETLVIPVALNVKSLAVETDPSGADIWINGVQASQTPHTFNILTGDTVVLELKMPGYAVYTDTVSLNENVDLGIIPLQKLFTLWISSMYDYTQYHIYDAEKRLVFSASGSRKCQLPQGRYSIAYEIGEGQYQTKSISLNYNASITIP